MAAEKEIVIIAAAIDLVLSFLFVAFVCVMLSDAGCL